MTTPAHEAETATHASDAAPGASWTAAQTRFGIRSEHATSVELCLFSPAGAEGRIPMERGSGALWKADVPSLRAGQRYGYRAHGPYAPERGHRFNPAKLLIDPWAKALDGPLVWDDSLQGYAANDPHAAGPDPRDSAPFVPKGVVVDPAFDWRGDRRPEVPWSRTVIYECHIRGMTQLHPQVPERHRGTYLGLASDPVLDHLQSLGVTAVELLPVQHSATDRRLSALGLTNYWGYNPVSFFAPSIRYATGGGGEQVGEFKEMVRRLHARGLEVLLDVVFNHTAEGDHLGPTTGLRGIDNALYYRLDPLDPRTCVDFTGCGNTLDVSKAAVRELVLESLRYWAGEMHVDGFRFDLATVLGRDGQTFSAAAPLFTALEADPLLRRVKLIAEPWDLGPEGYRLGEFPARWAEWNDRFRDGVRRFWTGQPGHLGDLASRLSGSSDVFARHARGPVASVNYVTCHDGFTLRDVASYERKHNEANGEHNRDGRDANFSRNWGAEGPTDLARVLHLRERAQRNLLATLAFSQGVPMLSHGDEIGRTQRGNNNAYCHDGPLTWVDWSLAEENSALLAFARRVFALRAGNAAFRRARWLDGHAGEVVWLRGDGAIMTEADWHDHSAHQLGMLLRSADGLAHECDPMLLLLNGGGRAHRFTLPAADAGAAGGTLWETVLCTHGDPAGSLAPASALDVGPHTLVLLRYRRFTRQSARAETK